MEAKHQTEENFMQTKPFISLCLVLLIVFMQACSALPRLDAVPEDLTGRTEISWLPDVRYRVNDPEEIEAFVQEGIDAAMREKAYLETNGHQGGLPPAAFLSLSGGGDGGAFGAGLLNGWTKAGNRPEFKLVTGISTGSLIAPFAFLGPGYDAALKHFYTTVSAEDIFAFRSFWAALNSDAMADSSPLKRLVAEAVDRDMLDEIAAAYDRGRLLMIGTVDMDSQVGVIWNMTKIAKSRDPRAPALFQSLMVASASIPGAFPPLMIEVEAEGRTFHEMHVDGGTMTQVFAYPPSVRMRQRAIAEGIQRQRTLYVIRNSKLSGEWEQVDRRTIDIAIRAIQSLIQTQGIGDLYRIFATAMEDGVDFNLAYIPEGFDSPHKEEFDTEYMRALYDFAYTRAVQGYPWEKVPPAHGE